ncbi:acyl-CoA carboxylase subunit epsilon [Streptomyces sp. NBC_00487]|uniref:acyl-CoA carboxylase subunit epsilon n=1 Tax=unclassified Streptomyces TaxID=2593676 RepID=UPI002E17926A|nr:MULTISPECIES: acyl-CoA carboxylase subunit epsilon [unclassified Streptomyces]
MTIKVVRGNPTPEELAAALTVVHARVAAAYVPKAPERLCEWADKARDIPRHTLTQPGSTTWRTSHWPR